MKELRIFCFYDISFGQTKMETIREKKLLFEIGDHHNARFIAQERGSFQTIPIKSSLSTLHIFDPDIQPNSYITFTFGSKTASFASDTSKVEETKDTSKLSLGSAHTIARNLRAHVRSISKPPTFHIASLNRYTPK